MNGCMMQSREKITDLLEQATTKAEGLEPEDSASIEGLHALFEQIGNIVQETDPESELYDQVESRISDAAEILEALLKEETEASDQSLETITKVLSDLQDVVGQMAVSEEPKPAPAAEVQQKEPEPEELIISEEDAPLIQDFITESNEHIEASEAGLLELENKPGDSETLNLIFRAFHTIKGMAGFMNLVQIGSLAHAAENVLDLARKGEMVLAGASTDVIFESIDLMKKMIANLKVCVENSQPVASNPQLPALLEKLKKVAENRGTDTTMDTSQANTQDAKLDTVLATDKKPEQSSGGKTQARSGNDIIKVNMKRLDNLINMVGELVISQLVITEDMNTLQKSEHSLNKKLSHHGKIIRELQELSMSMRMVPISGVFQKMSRLVRDLSRKAEKNVNLSVSGEDTELDRNIVDKIADPLVHMIRNSIDHGIEKPEDRTQAGKSAEGHIKLRAFHQSGNIVIEIEDDGRGLNKEKILQKAIANGVVNPDQQLTDQEIYRLIYHAGFSTAEKVTSVSGRGVGMDVVKKNIESLRGRIDIHSVLSKGTVFTIRLPLTLAIIDGQIIEVGDERYIIPINSILQSFRPTAGQISTVHQKGEVVMIRGELLPLIRLYHQFQIESSVTEPKDGLLVVVEEDEKKCCLLVDELLGQQQVVIKNLGDGMGSVRGISGGAIMGDGKVSLILDIQGLMALARNTI